MGGSAHAARNTDHSQVSGAARAARDHISLEDRPLVRGRTGDERGKVSSEEVSGMTAHASGEQAAGDGEATVTSNNVEKCVNCQFYDRRRARPTDGKVPMWGQCRRHSPHLNPVTAKSYVVEGVWPLVRDDDWCGEWRVLTRMLEELVPEPAAPVAGHVSSGSRTRPASAPDSVLTAAALGDD
jgi:hypothetical protein